MPVTRSIARGSSSPVRPNLQSSFANNLPQLAPHAQILFRRQPAAGNAFELGRIQPDEVRQRREIRLPADLSGGFQRGQLRFGNSRGGPLAAAAETLFIARALPMMSPR